MPANKIKPGLVITLIIFLSAGLFLTSLDTVRVVRAEDSGSLYFPETKHTISGKFLTYWQQHGGLAIFGYPITDPAIEYDNTDGRFYLTQWFERNVFQLHPEFANTPYEVELGLLGYAFIPASNEKPKYYNRADDAHFAGGTYYPETGHNLSNGFKDFWTSHGGLALFGYPISEEFEEENPDDGKIYTVQYFERNRFEYHPEFKGTPYVVELGRLGYRFPSPRIDNDLGDLSLVAKADNALRLLGIASDGSLYVATNTQPDPQNIIKKIGTNGEEITRWGGNGDTDGKFKYLVGGALDSHGNLFVVDAGNNRIQKFDPMGHFLGKFGSKGSDNGQFDDPVAIAIDSQDNIYAADSLNYRIEKFNSAGDFLMAWGSEGEKDGQFGDGSYYGMPLAVDSEDNLYVGDISNARVDKFTNTGQFLFSFYSRWPEFLMVDAQDNLYIAEHAFFSFTKFDKSGKQIQRLDKGANNPILGSLESIALNKQTSTFYLALNLGIRNQATDTIFSFKPPQN